jgi:hypothetical protein
LDDVLGWVIREATTNVIRHSRLPSCVIALVHDKQLAARGARRRQRRHGPHRATVCWGCANGSRPWAAHWTIVIDHGSRCGPRFMIRLLLAEDQA